MKKLISVMVLFVFLTLTTMAMASQVTFVGGSGYGPYQTGLGGEFTLDPSADLEWVLGSYASGISSNVIPGTFQSFCLEVSEHVSAYATYNAVLNNAAVLGGGGAVNGADPISIGTAYLYSEFAKGTLKDYAFTGTETAREASAALLQNAIWYLEGEGGAANYYYDLAKEVLLVNNVFADNNGKFNVAVLNLTASDGRHQDVLVATPIPPALWLLGSGLLGLVALHRKFKA